MPYKKETFLVLGSSSYIARNFMEKIKFHEVIKVEQSGFNKESGVIQTNQYSQKFLEKLLRKYYPDKIINFIGIARVSNKKAATFNNFFRVNCQISINLLEAIKTIPNYKPRIILIGSAAEYGHSINSKKCIFSEKSPTNPQSYYGITKKIQTEIGLFYARNFGMQINIIRFSNIIGLDMLSGFLISDITSQIKKGKRIINVGNLSSMRDFIEVNDATEGLKKILGLRVNGEIINISSGRGIVLREITDVITRLKKDIRFKESSKNIIPNYSALNNDKLIKFTSFRPCKNINAIIEKIINA